MTTRWFRLFLTFFMSFIRQKIFVTDTSTLSFRVWPFDADLKYMNNSSFWTIAEIGVMDLYLRSGALKICRKNQWLPLMTSQKMVFRRPLKRFMKFQLETRIIYWDERTIYFNHIFLKNGKLIANCFIDVVLVSKNGKIAPQKIMAELGVKSKPPYNDIIRLSNNLNRFLLHEIEIPKHPHNL